MTMIKSLLIVFSLTIAIYTCVVFLREGANFIPPFLNAIAAGTWQGQFNLDFAFYLVLSAIWLVWRHRFSRAGFGLAMLSVFGMAFFAPYLLIQTLRARGDVQQVLLGANAVR